MPAHHSARGLLSLLFNGSKAIDVVQASLEIGLLAALDERPAKLSALAEELQVVPLRLFKLLDCLETLGLVERTHEGDSALDVTYRGIEPLRDAAVAVVGPESQERDRDRHPWRAIHGQLPGVLRGTRSMPEDVFPWPPRSDEQIASFEASMAVGCAPILESVLAASDVLFGSQPVRRWLDVGGGDGTFARGFLLAHESVEIDVYNLPALKPLVSRTMGLGGTDQRLGFVAGDFLKEPLPLGYDLLSFVRVLHDWPNDVAVALMRKAFEAVAPGGRILVCEEFRNAERLAVQFFWSYFLIGVDGCVSRLRDTDFYVRVLSEIGFVDCRVLPGAFDIVVATRPLTIG